MPFFGSKLLTSLHLVNIQPDLKPHPPPNFSGSAPGDERSKFSIVNIGRFNKKQCEAIDNLSMLSWQAMGCNVSRLAVFCL